MILSQRVSLWHWLASVVPLYPAARKPHFSAGNPPSGLRVTPKGARLTEKVWLLPRVSGPEVEEDPKMAADVGLVEEEAVAVDHEPLGGTGGGLR